MKKIIIISGSVLLTVIVGIIIFSMTHSGALGVGNNPIAGVLPSSTAIQAPPTYPTGDTFQIGTPSGAVTVNNFYKHPVEISSDRTSVLVAKSGAYLIGYYTPNSAFIIAIMATPVPEMQTEAEAVFLSTLGISKGDACKLNVNVGVPYRVDPSYAGENLPLSFCPTGAFQAK